MQGVIKFFYFYAFLSVCAFASAQQEDFYPGYAFHEQGSLKYHVFTPAIVTSGNKENIKEIRERPFKPLSITEVSTSNQKALPTQLSALYSHGTEASPLWQAHFLSWLALERKVTIFAPDHSEDNTYDSKAVACWGSLTPRAEELIHTLSLVKPSREEEMPTLLLGHSRGAATCVRLLGGVEKSDGYKHTLDKLYRNPQNLPLSVMTQIQDSFSYQSHVLQNSSPDIYAAILLAPFGGLNFTSESLEAIKTPTLIFSFKHDKISEKVQETYGLMPNAKIVELPGTHWTCLDEGTSHHGNLTQDPEGVDRHEVHVRIKLEIQDFLSEVLTAQKKTPDHVRDHFKARL